MYLIPSYIIGIERYRIKWIITHIPILSLEKKDGKSNIEFDASEYLDGHVTSWK